MTEQWTYHGHSVVSKLHRDGDGKRSRMFYVRYSHEGRSSHSAADPSRRGSCLQGMRNLPEPGFYVNSVGFGSETTDR